MHVVLIEPQIAPNTGNIIRLCANTGASLHLIQPLGFDLDDRLLKRGGLDYHEHASVTVHSSINNAVLHSELGGRWFAFSSHSRRRYDHVDYRRDDVVVFGREQTGLHQSELDRFEADYRLTIPMQPDSRSLNLANAVAIVVYEAWRQEGFPGCGPATTDDGRHGLTSEAPGAPPFDR